jgi:hypothetical protein
MHFALLVLHIALLENILSFRIESQIVRTFGTSMGDNRRNISSGIFLLGLLIVFISFFLREKDKHNETSRSVISYTISSSVQAIIVPEISRPGPDKFWVKKLNTKFTCLDYDSSREIMQNRQISSCYNSYQLEFQSKNFVIGIIFPQKVPDQGNDDDVLSIT